MIKPKYTAMITSILIAIVIAISLGLASSASANIGETCSTDCHGDTAAPNKPSIRSSTHPYSSRYYRSASPSFSWASSDSTASYASGIRGYSYRLDRSATTNAGTSAYVTSRSRSYSALANGAWYFHVRAVDNGPNWGATNHFRVNIDTYKPRTYAPRSASVKYGSRTRLYWKVYDPYTAGRAYVTIKVRRGTRVYKTISLGLVPINSTKYYTYRATLRRARYTFNVYARDRAGNNQYNVAARTLVIK